MSGQHQGTGPAGPEIPNLDGILAPSNLRALGVDDVRFDLSDLYQGPDDPQIKADLLAMEAAYRAFDDEFRGNLATRLGDALEKLAEVKSLKEKLEIFLRLNRSCDQVDQNRKRALTEFEERKASSAGKHLSFFKIELSHLKESVIDTLAATDHRVAFHRPWIEQLRKEARHLFSDEIERALIMRAPFGASRWGDFVKERLAALVITVPADHNWGAEAPSKTLSLGQARRLLSESPNMEVRAAVLKRINAALKMESPLAVQALNVTIGEKIVEERERSYRHSMSRRNLTNMASDEAVNALHESVRSKSVGLVYTCYRLMAKELGIPILAWSDRLAPLARTTSVVPWDEAVQIVSAAFGSFSPTLKGHFDRMVREKRIDAAHYPNKDPGAFNLSAVLPNPIGARSYVLLNYMGTLGDVSTLAHEAGHAVHGELAGETQGSLLQDAPFACAEIASIFSQMVVSQYLLERVSSPEEKFTFLMEQVRGFMQSVVRQISFSAFEQKIHEARKSGELTTDEFIKHWRDATREFYGSSGKVLTYENTDYLWVEVPHFYRPFSVYGYAFAYGAAQSLHAAKETLGDKFEPLYLDLLRAGRSKDAV